METRVGGAAVQIFNRKFFSIITVFIGEFLQNKERERNATSVAWAGDPAVISLTVTYSACGEALLGDRNEG